MHTHVHMCTHTTQVHSHKHTHTQTRTAALLLIPPAGPRHPSFSSCCWGTSDALVRVPDEACVPPALGQPSRVSGTGASGAETPASAGGARRRPRPGEIRV